MKTHFLKISFSVLFLCLISLTFLNSCKKDEDDSNPTQTRPLCQISKLYNADKPTDYTLYQYDKQGKPLQSTNFFEGKEKAVLTYEYNPQGRLIKLTIKDKYQRETMDVTDVFTFEYNAQGQVTKYTKARPIPQEGYYSEAPYVATCEYDAEGNRTKKTITFSNGAPPQVTIFTYQNGNCIKSVSKAGSTFERIFKYEYYLDQENKTRPFDQTSVLAYQPGPMGNKNMLKKAITTDKENPEYINSTIQYTYEYNEKGFPTKNIIAYTSQHYSFTTTNSLEYECH